MDTPGGLDKSMRELNRAILAAPLPVITYVAPNGARAASAGTYIAYASHIAAMAPATNIGSSTPVSIAPAPVTPASPEGQEEEAPPADAMTRKVVNDAVAYLEGLAELRGRNIEWAEETVRSGANVRASEALEAGIIDLIADDLPALLEAVDGWEVPLEDGMVTLDTAGAGVYRVEADWKHELLELITDPTIAYGLLIFGIYGLILEFYNPGMVFPSVIGIVCLLLGAYGLQMLPVNYAGLALILVGIAMMIGEVFTPTMGVLGIAGVVAFVMGFGDASGYRICRVRPAVGGHCRLCGEHRRPVSVYGWRRRPGPACRRPDWYGKHGRGGSRGARDVFEHGRVRGFGEIWQARTQSPVQAGQAAEVVEVDGLTLVVRPQEDLHGDKES